MHYDASVYWNKGAVNDINKDSLVLMQALTSRGRILLAVVCDGIGKMGQCASGYLTEEFMTWFDDGLPDVLEKKKALCAIRRFVERKVCMVQCRMREYTEKCGQEIGTTLSMLLLWEKQYMLWHLGSSRIYRLRTGGKFLHRHCEFGSVRKSEEMPKYIGSGEFFLPEFESGLVKSGDAFLLCSEAFICRMTSEEIAGVLAPKEMPEERCKRRLREIGEAAMRRGERDNMSAVYVRISAHRKVVVRHIKEIWKNRKVTEPEGKIYKDA